MKPNIQIIFYFLMLLVMSSCTQKTDTKNQASELISYEKKPNDVIKSLYLDEIGNPSREVFLRSWGLFPIQKVSETKAYFTISFSIDDVSEKNGYLIPNKNAKAINSDFFTKYFTKYKSANISEPVWDGRVYENKNKIIVGGYSDKLNEKPVGEINSKGQFISELKDDYAMAFPILKIPTDQLIFDPFNWQLIRLKPGNGETVEKQVNSFLPIKLFENNGKELNNLQFELVNKAENNSVTLYGFINGHKFEIANCNFTNTKIVKKVDGFRPGLIEGCTQAGNSEIVSFTFEGQFTDFISQNDVGLCLNSKSFIKSEIINSKTQSAFKEEIIIDGNLSDWYNIKGISDTKGDFVSYLYPNPDADLLEFKLTNDEKYLYVYTRVAGAHGRTGEKGRYYWYVYIDVDTNPKTGYPPTRDDNCYFGVAIGDDCEAQFEFIDNNFVKTFFGFTGIGAEKEVLNGKLKLGSSFYAPEDADGNKRKDYKIEYVMRDNKRHITHDYTEGTSEDIIIALSADASELELKVELAGFLQDESGKSLMLQGQKIDIAAGAEASSNFYDSKLWGADSSPTIYGYVLK